MYRAMEYKMPSYDSSQGTAAGATATGGAGMDPMTGAAIGAGGSFLAAYLNARAQEEENRKKAIQEAIQTQGQQEQNAMSNMGSWYARALLGG